MLTLLINSVIVVYSQYLWVNPCLCSNFWIPMACTKKIRTIPGMCWDAWRHKSTVRPQGYHTRLMSILDLWLQQWALKCSTIHIGVTSLTGQRQDEFSNQEELLFFIDFFKNFLNWTIVDLQYCIIFKGTKKWSLFRFFSIVDYCKILNIVPCGLQ